MALRMRTVIESERDYNMRVTRLELPLHAIRYANTLRSQSRLPHAIALHASLKPPSRKSSLRRSHADCLARKPGEVDLFNVDFNQVVRNLNGYLIDCGEILDKDLAIHGDKICETRGNVP